MTAGVASGANYLEHDPQFALLAGAQVGSVAAGMAFVGAWTERRRMTRVARAAASLAVGGRPTARPTTRPRPGSWPSAAPTGSPSPRPPGQAAGNPDAGRALGLPGRVAVLRALL